MNTSVPDQLLVSLAHAPLPPSLLDSVLGKAASISNELLESVQQKISEVEKEEEDEKKNQEHPNGCNSNVDKEYAITHVILTGSPNVITPGKFIPDWETQWTSGEKVLAQFVENIGLNRFHRLSSKGKCRLKGRLVDINPWECSQFQAAKNGGGTQRSHNNNINQSSVTLDEEDKENNTQSATTTTTVGPNVLDGMDSEFTRIANLILQLFIREEKYPIQNITILLPLEPRHSGEGIREDILGMANDIFGKCWRDVAGPFNGVTPNIIIVDK